MHRHLKDQIHLIGRQCTVSTRVNLVFAFLKNKNVHDI